MLGRIGRDKRGQFQLLLLIVLAICIVIVVSFFSLLPPASARAAITRLENEGYVVLSSAEYASLSSRIDALKVSADAAVVNAEAAVTTSQTVLNKLLLHNENEVFLFPESVSSNITLTSGTPADTFGSWAEITDSSAATLSSKFSASSGYIVEIMTHNCSAADKIYIIEVSYGAAKTVIGRIKLRSDWTYVIALRSNPVTPVGEVIYYRMKSETAGATLQADFRYYYD